MNWLLGYRVKAGRRPYGMLWCAVDGLQDICWAPRQHCIGSIHYHDHCITGPGISNTRYNELQVLTTIVPGVFLGHNLWQGARSLFGQSEKGAEWPWRPETERLDGTLWSGVKPATQSTASFIFKVPWNSSSFLTQGQTKHKIKNKMLSRQDGALRTKQLPIFSKASVI